MRPSQFDKIILLDKIIEDTNKHKDKRHKEILKKISEMINVPITYYEKLFSTDNMEQFEIINIGRKWIFIFTSFFLF